MSMNGYAGDNYGPTGRWTAKQSAEAGARAAELAREREIAYRCFHRGQTAVARIEDLEQRYGATWRAETPRDGALHVYSIHNAAGEQIDVLSVYADGWTETNPEV